MTPLYESRVKLTVRCFGVIEISIKKYMIIDLLVIALTGLIFEIIVMYIFLEMFGSHVVPFYIISLLITIISVGRWNYKGLVMAPIMSLISVLCGYLVRRMTDSDGYAIYNWKMYITNCLSLLTAIVIIPFKKMSKTFNENKDGAIATAIIFGVMVLAYLVEVLSYGVLTLTNPIEYLAALAVVNIPCWFFTILVMFILRKQGIVVDVKKNLISKKKEAELEQEYYSKYRNEILEKPNEDDEESLK